ncbi:MAG: hypothetical protein HOM25_02190 [Rhodospirillaceae bacterium]|jgi:hypothetical protein|nr:hypothetical protein [Rhodospirillaceae bacterium]MBT5663886.1 hypothetical protein [Rhodospirillaceae bacterium]MBT5811060.1 hypothetical protein [Rhodospirillaceae bacterium]
MKRNSFVRLSAALLMLGLGACETSNPFTTAGSLRVDVEVYKGPLSKEPSVQWAELVALIQQSYEALSGIKSFSNRLLKESEIFPSSRQTEIDGICKLDDECSIHYEIDTALRLVEEFKNSAEAAFTSESNLAAKEAEIRKVLIKTSNGTVQLKAKAFLVAQTQASASIGYLFRPGGRLERNVVTNFANWAAEYGNLIGSRADALLKQMQIVPVDRRELPLSVYIRDTEPTDFLNLLIWNRAAAPAIWEEMLLSPIHAFTSEETTDRVRVVETLFADHNWSRINTVYASGQGETSIALIKDDIGNWNLKSFDSDPTELLDAYKNLTLAGVKAATQAVGAAATGGQSAVLKSALGTASKLTQGQIGGSGGGGDAFNVANLHSRTEAKIAAEGKAQQKKYKKTTEEDKQKSVTEETIKELRRILDTHLEVIDMIEESLVSK